jgi:hypothetical protein
MKNNDIDFNKICGVNFGDAANSYHYKRIFGHFDVKARITDFFISKLEEKFIPWGASWCRPWPVNYETREVFRGLNFFMLRSNHAGFCPYWVPEPFLIKNNIKLKKGEKSTPVILKKEGVSYIERFFNIDQLKFFDMPAIDNKPVKPAIKDVTGKIFEFFGDLKEYDEFKYSMNDFKGQDPDYYYYLLFQYCCYNWYCQTYNKNLSFKPEQHNKETLIYQVGASLLASYCRISTPNYSSKGLERNRWEMLLMGDKNVIFDVTKIALTMYDAFFEAAEMKKAS